MAVSLVCLIVRGGASRVDGGVYVALADAALICQHQLIRAAAVRIVRTGLFCFTPGIKFFISLRYKVRFILDINNIKFSNQHEAVSIRT